MRRTRYYNLQSTVFPQPSTRFVGVAIPGLSPPFQRIRSPARKGWPPPGIPKLPMHERISTAENPDRGVPHAPAAQTKCRIYSPRRGRVRKYLFELIVLRVGPFELCRPPPAPEMQRPRAFTSEPSFGPARRRVLAIAGVLATCTQLPLLSSPICGRFIALISTEKRTRFSLKH